MIYPKHRYRGASHNTSPFPGNFRVQSTLTACQSLCVKHFVIVTISAATPEETHFHCIYGKIELTILTG